MIGLLIIVSRTKALTQVVGYLVMENGIFFSALPSPKACPFSSSWDFAGCVRRCVRHGHRHPSHQSRLR
jgi:hypothetical protein